MAIANDPYRYFRIEAREIAEQLGKGALEIEKGTSDPDMVARLLRFAHTLKGAARVIKQPEIADQAHAVEDTLTPYRGSVAPVPRDSVDALLRLVDGIGRRVAALAVAPTEDVGAASTVSTQAEALISAVRFDNAEMDELLDGISEAHAQLGVLRRTLESTERARHLVGLLVGDALRPRTGMSAQGPKEGAASISEELRAIFGSMDRIVTDGIELVDRELRQVRDAVERLRLIPASALLTSLERSARDVAQAQGKPVVFEGRGGDLRLDAQVLGAIQAALSQVVRNAVAHGIESPSDRQAAGKPPDGRILIEVMRMGRTVIFRCRDDGRGIDVEAVRRSIERKGLPPAQTRNLGSEELLQMLLGGGITTSRVVTEISGRGIGLDLVRETVERLGGEVSLQTEPGRGVTVEIVVPFSVASLEALVVEASGITAAIPLEAVGSCVRVAADGFAQTPTGQTIVYNGRTIPFRPLGGILSARAPARAARSWSTVIVEGARGAAAFGMDRLRGTSSVVLRPLPELAPASAIVAGVSLNAEGNPQLVLDPDGLVAEAHRDGTAQQIHSELLRCPVLIIDDSLTTRMLEQSVLESAGYEVDVAVSGEEGLEKARHRKYGLFLVDVEMPGIDGFTFIERTRADPALRDVPAILVTSRASPDDLKRGKEVGAHALVAKTEFNQETLLEHIRELVG